MARVGAAPSPTPPPPRVRGDLRSTGRGEWAGYSPASFACHSLKIRSASSGGQSGCTGGAGGGALGSVASSSCSRDALTFSITWREMRLRVTRFRLARRATCASRERVSVVSRRAPAMRPSSSSSHNLCSPLCTDAFRVRLNRRRFSHIVSCRALTLHSFSISSRNLNSSRTFSRNCRCWTPNWRGDGGDLRCAEGALRFMGSILLFVVVEERCGRSAARLRRVRDRAAEHEAEQDG